jgi:putative inorganic carbon (hco3(-)) transporter
MFGYSTSRSLILNGIIILFFVAFGVISSLLALAVSHWSLYRMIFVIFVLLLVPACLAVTGSIARALLVALVLAFPFSFSLALFGTVVYLGKPQTAFVLNLYDFPLIGLIVLWMWDVIITRRRSLPKSNILLPAVLWIIWSMVSIYNSTNLMASWLGIIRMVKLCILMLAVATLVRDKRDIRALFIAFFISVVIQSVVCIVQYMTGSFFNLLDLGAVHTGNMSRVPGTMGWPNTVGAFLAALTSMAFILYITKADKKITVLSLIAALMGFIALIATYSRGSWLSFIIALFFSVFVAHLRKWLNVNTALRLFVIAGVLIVVVLTSFSSTFTQDILVRLNQIESSPGAINDRISLNIIAENMILSHPLLGVGLNTFVEVLREYDTIGISYTLAYPVHNAYLLIASETGLVGLGLFLVFTGTTLVSLFRVVKNMDRLTSVSAICLVSGMVAILVSNIADVHLLYSEQIFVLFWFLAGFGIALLGMKQPSESSRTLAGTLE